MRKPKLSKAKSPLSPHRRALPPAPKPLTHQELKRPRELSLLLLHPRNARHQCQKERVLALPEHPVNGKQVAFKRLLWAALEDTDGAQ